MNSIMDKISPVVSVVNLLLGILFLIWNFLEYLYRGIEAVSGLGVLGGFVLLMFSMLGFASIWASAKKHTKVTHPATGQTGYVVTVDGFSFWLTEAEYEAWQVKKEAGTFGRQQMAR